MMKVHGVKKLMESIFFFKQKLSPNIKARQSGQTREGIGAVAVRLLRRHAFADAPNTSVVLCFPGEEGQDGEWRSGDGGGKYRKKMRAVQRRKRVCFFLEGGFIHVVGGDRLNRNRKEENQNTDGWNETD